MPTKSLTLITRTWRLWVLALLGLFVCLGTPGPVQAADNPIDDAQKQAIEDIIHDYLLSHPAVLGEALENYLAQREAIREQQASQALAQNWSALSNPQTAFVAGNLQAATTIIEFFDYNCGYCRIAMPTMMKVLKDRNDVRVIFREYPIRGADSEAVARAALAARTQGKYLELHAQLMQVEDRMTLERFDDIAAQADLDIDQIHSDMTTPAIDGAIAGNFILADMLHVDGTPSFIVGNRILYGWPGEEDFLKIIDEQVAAQTGASDQPG